MTHDEYVPGVCNIGAAEVSRRRLIGWIGLGVAVLLFVVLYLLGVNRFWRWAVFFPAVLSASGFIQARAHFCVGFASMGVSNFGPLGQTQPTVGEADRARDKARGNLLTLYASLIGVVAGAVSFVV